MSYSYSTSPPKILQSDVLQMDSQQLYWQCVFSLTRMQHEQQLRRQNEHDEWQTASNTGLPLFTRPPTRVFGVHSTHNSQSPSLPHTRTLVDHIYPSPDCTLALDSEERIDTPKRARLANDLNMPYRSELKRPDLKGNFPCSVCGKMFCHSSSLSRHRMQAHFKSYQCTMCDIEISTNETLRSHMFRSHNISRMFMCRCCNWAFPDKTSLHIHMQSMARNGTPGDVQILAKSTTEEGDMADLSLFTSAFNGTAGTHSTSPSLKLVGDAGDHSTSSTPTSPAISPPAPTASADQSAASMLSHSQLFPSLNFDGLMSKLMNGHQMQQQMPKSPFAQPPPALLNQVQTDTMAQSLLQQWMVNNLGANQMAAMKALQCTPLQSNPLLAFLQNNITNMMHNTTTVASVHSQQQDTNNNMDTTTSKVANVKRELDMAGTSTPPFKTATTGSPQKKGKGLEAALSHLIGRHQQNNCTATVPPLVKAGSHGQNSPVGSSHSRASSSTVPESSESASPTNTAIVAAPPPVKLEPVSPAVVKKCFECQMIRGKLTIAENRSRFLESKLTSQESKISRLEAQNNASDQQQRRTDNEHRALRLHSERLERALLMCQEKALRCMQNCESAEQMKMVLEEMLENTASLHTQTSVSTHAQ